MFHVACRHEGACSRNLRQYLHFCARKASTFVLVSIACSSSIRLVDALVSRGARGCLTRRSAAWLRHLSNILVLIVPPTQHGLARLSLASTHCAHCAIDSGNPCRRLLQLRQYLYFCTIKASKLSVPASTILPAAASVFVLLYH